MIGNLKFIDFYEYNFEPLSKFCVQISEHLTAISTNEGVLLMKVHPDLSQEGNGVNHYKLLIKPSTYMLMDHLEIDLTGYIYDLPQDCLYNCLLQNNISGSLPHLKKKNFYMSKFSLGPRELIGEECVVATITDASSVDIYAKICHIIGLTKFERILNVNDLHIKKFKYRWKGLTDKSAEESQEELMHRLAMHSATAVCWTHMLKDTKRVHDKKDNSETLEYCCLIVAYADGNIVFWQLKQSPVEDYENITLFFMYEYQSNMKNITQLSWHSLNGNSGLLIIGDKSGKSIVVSMQNLIPNYCKNGEAIILTDSTDISVEYIDAEVKDNYFIIYIVQQSHVLIFSLNKDGEICQRMDYNCSNLNITGFQKTLGGSIILSAVTGAIIEIKTSIIENKLKFEKRQIYLDMDWTKNILLGFALSKNNVILSLVTRHIGYHYKGPLMMKIFNFSNNETQALSAFMKLDRIYDGLDLLELLKIRSVENKVIIGNEFPADMDYDNLTLAELKKYLCIAKISEIVSNQVDSITQYNIKQASDITMMIYTQLCMYLLGEIVKELKSKGAVSVYKQEVGHICYTHLKDIVISDFLHVHNLKKNYVNVIIKLLHECTGLNLQEDMLCKICEQPFVGLSCPSRHADSRCSFSMVQITYPKLKCPLCGSYVAEEAVAFSKNLSCTMCDSPLETIVGKVQQPFEFKQFCKDDCLSNV